MIGNEDGPGLDAGLGGCRDRDLLLGKSGPSLLPWAAELPYKVVNTIDGAARSAALFFERSGRPWPASQSPGLVPTIGARARDEIGK
jgi:hypothetical protein